MTTGRKMIAARRSRVPAAQRARWAKAKGEKVVPITVRKRHRLSASSEGSLCKLEKAVEDGVNGQEHHP